MIRALRWFLGANAVEPVMEDLDLDSNRIFRDHRLPIHQARTEREKDSRVVQFPRRADAAES